MNRIISNPTSSLREMAGLLISSGVSLKPAESASTLVVLLSRRARKSSALVWFMTSLSRSRTRLALIARPAEMGSGYCKISRWK